MPKTYKPNRERLAEIADKAADWLSGTCESDDDDGRPTFACWSRLTLGEEAYDPVKQTPCAVCVNGAIQIAQDPSLELDYDRYEDPELGYLAREILITGHKLSGRDLADTFTEGRALSFGAIFERLDQSARQLGEHDPSRAAGSCGSLQDWNDVIVPALFGETSQQRVRYANEGPSFEQLRAEYEHVIEVLRETARRLRARG